MKEILRQLTPPVIWSRIARSPLGPARSIDFAGDYVNWSDAERASRGYASVGILEKAKQAMLKVRRGEAAYERDTVLFDEIEYSFPVLAGLLYAASRNSNRLSVLDFGGSLGTSYIQNRAFFAHLDDFRWSIVDQPQVVAVGRELFEDAHLKFHESIESAVAQSRPDVVLLSSVLQYLPEPFALIEAIKALAPEFILVDRAPLLDTAPSRLTVQTVPPSIYDASYPCWILNKAQLAAAFAIGYRKRLEFPAHAGTVIQLDGAQAGYWGWLFEKVAA